MNKKEKTIYLQKVGDLLEMTVHHDGETFGASIEKIDTAGVLQLLDMGTRTLYITNILGNKEYKRVLESEKEYHLFPDVPKSLTYPVEFI